MEELVVEEHATRYAYRDFPYGIPETQPLDFSFALRCSKGQGISICATTPDLRSAHGRLPAELHLRTAPVRDRGSGLGGVVHQSPSFSIAITIYGDGKQVRDLLYVEDLLNAYDAATARIDQAAGQVYNVGGGAENQLSIWEEFRPLLEQMAGHPIPVVRGEWRPGDQRLYVSDIRKAAQELDWKPRISVGEGIDRLYRWVKPTCTCSKRNDQRHRAGRERPKTMPSAMRKRVGTPMRCQTSITNYGGPSCMCLSS